MASHVVSSGPQANFLGGKWLNESMYHDGTAKGLTATI